MKRSSFLLLTVALFQLQSIAQKINKKAIPISYSLSAVADIKAAEVPLDGITNITDLSFDLSKKIITAKDSSYIPLEFSTDVELFNDNKYDAVISTIEYKLLYNNTLIASGSTQKGLTIGAGDSEKATIPFSFDAYQLVGKGFDEYSIVKLLFTFPAKFRNDFILQLKPTYTVKKKLVLSQFETIY